MNAAALDSVATTWGEWALLWVLPSGPGFWLLLDLAFGALLAFLPASLWPRRRLLLRGIKRLGIPFLAVLFAAVAPQGMGLTGVDWETGLRLGLPLVAGLLILLGLVRLTVRPDAEQLAAAEPGATPFALVWAGVEQLHWCFQRAALLALLLALPSAPQAAAFWATWAAILVALPGVFQLRSGWARLWTFVALAATAILFLYTRNFWLCWVLHAGIALLAGPVERQPHSVRGDYGSSG